MTDTALIKSALAEQVDRGEAETIYNALELHRSALERKVPTGVMTYAYAEAALKTELRANDKLREADPAKVLGAYSYTLQLGLPLGPLGLAYLIPYKQEVACAIGYQGKIELAYRSGLVQAVEASLVYEGDPFEDNGGTAPPSQRIVHKKAPRGDRAIVAAYAIGWLKGATRPVPKVIYEEDWEKSRQASPLGRLNKGLWADDFPAAVLKTAYHRLAKQLPKTPAMMLAETVDETFAEPVDDPVPTDE
jgi:recombination protein RecT